MLRAALARARAAGLTPAALTFDRHPLATLAPAAAPRCLMTPAQRLRGLSAFGFRRLVVLRFDRRFARLAPAAFVRTVLVRRLRAAELIVGYDFHFGRGGTGDAALLRRLGAVLGFGVTVVGPALDRSEPVSSTRIRRLVALGRMGEAARLLGRPYAVEGRIVRGRGRGRALGFPTVNLRPANELLPPYGVYAVRLAGRRGVANLGVRPTVDSRRTAPLLEVHTFGAPPRLRVGACREVEVLSFLRPERRFPGVAALARQIARDIAAARRTYPRSRT